MEVLHPLVLHLAEDEARRARDLDLQLLAGANLASRLKVELVPCIFPDEGLQHETASHAAAVTRQADTLSVHEEDERFTGGDEEPFLLDQDEPDQEGVFGPGLLDLPDFQEELLDIQEARVVDIDERRDARRLGGAFELVLHDGGRLFLRRKGRQAGGQHQHGNDQFFEHGLSLSEWTL